MSIEIYDNIIDASKYYSRIVGLDYKYFRKDQQSSGKIPEVYWTYEFYSKIIGLDSNREIVSSEKFWENILKTIEKSVPGVPNREHLYSCYINALRFGDDPQIHCDASHSTPTNKTILVYMNVDWNPNWGGETIFFDGDLDSRLAVQPRPGRVVMFDGRIPHSGRPFSIGYRYYRYIIAFKYMDPTERSTEILTLDDMGIKLPKKFGVEGFEPKTVSKIWSTMEG